MTQALRRTLFVYASLATITALSLGCAARRAMPQVVEPQIAEEPEHIELEPQEFMNLLVAALRAKAKVEAKTKIPIEINDLVINEIAFFLLSARKQLNLGFDRLPMYEDEILSILKDEAVPQELIYVAFVESRFNPEAVSPSGAMGMWQLMDETARQLGLTVTKTHDQRKNVRDSTRAAAKYLKMLYAKFNDWYFALAAYNAGPSTVSKIIETYRLKNYWDMCLPDVPIKDETKRYVAQFLASLLIFEAPEEFGVE